MEYKSDRRERSTTGVLSEGIKADYTVLQATGQPIDEINGKISKEGEAIGRLHFNLKGDNVYISIDKYSELTAVQFAEVLAKVAEQVRTIQTEP